MKIVPPGAVNRHGKIVQPSRSGHRDIDPGLAAPRSVLTVACHKENGADAWTR